MTTPHLRDIFRKYDSTGDTVTTGQLGYVLSELGISKLILHHDAINALSHLMDSTNSGRIEFHDFCEWWRKLENDRDKQIFIIMCLYRIMKRFGDDLHISRDHFREIWSEMGNDENSEQVISKMDNGGNRISFLSLVMLELRDETFSKLWLESTVDMDSAVRMEMDLTARITKQQELQGEFSSKLTAVEAHQDSFVQIFDDTYKRMNQHDEILQETNHEFDKLREDVEQFEAKIIIVEHTQEMRITSKIDELNHRLDAEADRITNMGMHHQGQEMTISNLEKKLVNEIQNIRVETKEPIAGLESNIDSRLASMQDMTSKLEKDIQDAILLAQNDNQTTKNDIQESQIKTECAIMDVLQKVKTLELTMTSTEQSDELNRTLEEKSIKMNRKIEEEKQLTQRNFDNLVKRFDVMERELTAKVLLQETRIQQQEALIKDMQKEKELLAGELDREKVERKLVSADIESLRLSFQRRGDIFDDVQKNHFQRIETLEKSCKGELEASSNKLEQVSAQLQNLQEKVMVKVQNQVDQVKQEQVQLKQEQEQAFGQAIEQAATNWKTNLDELSEKIEQKVTTLADTFENKHSGFIQTENQRVEMIMAQIRNINDMITGAIGERMDQIQTQITHIDEKLETKVRGLGDLLDEKLLSMTGEFQMIRTDMGDRIADAEHAQQHSLKASFDKIEKEMSRLSEKITAFKAQEEQLKLQQNQNFNYAHDVLEKNLVTIEEKLQSQLSTTKTNVDTLQKKFDDTVKKIIDSLRSQQGSNNSKIEQVTDLVRATKDDLAKQLKSMDGLLQTQIGKQSDSSKILTDEIGQIQQQRTKLETILEDVETARRRVKRAAREREAIQAEIEDMRANCHCEATDYQNRELKEKMELMSREMGVMRSLLKMHVKDVKGDIEKHRTLLALQGKRTKKNQPEPVAQTETLKLIGCKWRRDLLPDTFRILEDGQTVRCADNRSDFVLVGSVIAPSNAISFWEVELRPKGTDLAYVGIVPDHDEHVHIKPHQGWMLRSDGLLFEQERTISSKYCESFVGKEVRIGVLLDLNKGNVVYFKDGKPLSVAFKHVSGRVRPAVAIYGKTSVTTDFNTTVLLK
jgi:chromosome segregation ATPase